MVTLPEELLKSVCLQLRPTLKDIKDDRAKRNALLSMTLASKACYRVAKPELYHSLDLRDRDLERLQPVVSSLLTSPASCDLVKEIHISSWEAKFSHDMHDRTHEGATNEETLDVSAALKGLDLPCNFLHQLKDGVSGSLQDALFAVLLLTCLKLETIHLQAPLEFRRTLVSKAIDWSTADMNSSAAAVKSLVCLQEISIEHRDTEGATTIDEFARVLQLPSLVTLKGVMLDLVSPSTSINLLASALKHVHLKSSLLDAAGASWLLNRCPRLEKLYVHWGGSSVGRCNLHFDQISAAVNRKGSDLQTLRLLTDDADPLNDESLPIGNIQEMASLRILALPCDALFADETQAEDEHPTRLNNILPFSLETLRIMRADDDEAEAHDEQLLSLMTDDRFASLKTIRINRRERFTADLSSLLWEDSTSNRFWVILNRK